MLGQQLRSVRRARRWTQGDLASALGVSQTTIARWETDGIPSRRHYAALAELLGVSVGEVAELALGEEETTTPGERLAAIEATLAELHEAILGIRAILDHRDD